MTKKIIIYLFILLFPLSSFASTSWKAPDQEKAKERTKENVSFIKGYKKECQILRKVRFKEEGISLKDIIDRYFLLDSPIINKKENNYSPVRFAHKRHAARTDDCSSCHHYSPKGEESSDLVRCSACHQDSFNKENPERIGLKAAYHQKCVECHKTEKTAPVTCTGCHLKNVPNHKELVKLPDNPTVTQVTKECLKCHKDAAEDMLTSSHWLWKGQSAYTIERRKQIMHGKGTTALNNY